MFRMALDLVMLDVILGYELLQIVFEPITLFRRLKSSNPLQARSLEKGPHLWPIQKKMACPLVQSVSAVWKCMPFMGKLDERCSLIFPTDHRKHVLIWLGAMPPFLPVMKLRDGKKRLQGAFKKRGFLPRHCTQESGKGHGAGLMQQSIERFVDWSLRIEGIIEPLF